MAIHRRAFLESSAIAAIGAAGWPAVHSAKSAEPANDTLTLSAPLTHSDWMLKANGPKWGPEGVRHMLDACKACGWSNVYWRVWDAGVLTYRSKLLRPGCKAEADNFFQPQGEADLAARQKLAPLTPERAAVVIRQLNAIDYSQFDSLAAAIDYGHKIGLKIRA